MDARSLVLTALAPARGGMHSPVQIQKLLFLIQENIPKAIGGGQFNFQAYDYGPFDKTVYDILRALAADGLVEVVEEPGRTWKRYRLTDKGQELGQRLLESLNDKDREYVEAVSKFVRSVSFAQLISAIYKEYPEMQVNSVFGNP